MIALIDVVSDDMVQAVNCDDRVEPISIVEIENVHCSPLHFRIPLRERFLDK